MARGHRLLLPATYMLGIFALSSIPGDQPDTELGRIFQWVQPQVQNLLHIPLFGGLAASWYWALPGHRQSQRIAFSIGITILYGCFDEWHQLHVPGRYASWTDLALNAAGVALAAILIKLGRRRRSLAQEAGQ